MLPTTDVVRVERAAGVIAGLLVELFRTYYKIGAVLSTRMPNC